MAYALIPRDLYREEDPFFGTGVSPWRDPLESVLDGWFALPQDREIHRQRPQTQWVHKIDLSGYSPKEITVKNEEGKVIVTAHHKNGDDHMDLRRCVKIPEDVDQERVRAQLTGQLLVIQGPRKMSQTLSRPSDPLAQMLRNTRVVTNEKTGKESFQVDIPCKDFKPEELKILQEGNRVILEAEHKGDTEYKTFRREFTLPAGADVTKVNCVMDNEGTLRVETPYRAVKEVEPKAIAIGKTDSTHAGKDAPQAMEQ